MTHLVHTRLTSKHDYKQGPGWVKLPMGGPAVWRVALSGTAQRPLLPLFGAAAILNDRVQPVLLGSGIPAFPALDHDIKLRLLETRRFQSGVTFLRYQTDN